MSDPTISSSGKRIEQDGKFYRMRRGKLVEIPRGWVNKVTNEQTIRKRTSKLTGKVKQQTKLGYDYQVSKHKMLDDDA